MFKISIMLFYSYLSATFYTKNTFRNFTTDMTHIIGQYIYNIKKSTTGNSTTISLPELNIGVYLLKIDNNLENISTFNTKMNNR